MKKVLFVAVEVSVEEGSFSDEELKEGLSNFMADRLQSEEGEFTVDFVTVYNTADGLKAEEKKAEKKKAALRALSRSVSLNNTSFTDGRTVCSSAEEFRKRHP